MDRFEITPESIVSPANAFTAKPGKACSGEGKTPSRCSVARLIGVAVLFLTVGTSFAQNQPPQRIWHKEAVRIVEDATSVYFYDWTWIGDQNGDDCDELLICQEPLIHGDGPRDAVNQVELYFGD